MLSVKIVLIALLSVSWCGYHGEAKAAEVNIFPGPKERHAVPSDIIIEIKRDIVDMGEEKGVVSLEKVNINSESMKMLNKKYGLVSIRKLYPGMHKDAPSDIYVFKFPPGTKMREVIAAYKKDVNAVYVESNRIAYVH